MLVGLATVPSYAADTSVHTETTTRVTRPLAVDGETNQIKPAIQRFVERINMARVALSTANPTEAKFDLDEAEKHLKFIKSNSNYQQVTKETKISSGEVVYDTNTKYNNYYVPLEEGPVVIKDYTTTENQAGEGNKKAIAVKSARVVYLNLDLEGTKAEDAIAVARSGIREGNLSAADDALGQLLTQITTTTVVDSVPKIVAQDNLKLALTFLQENNYVASRFALDQAREALKKIPGDKATGLSARLAQIHDLVNQQTENTAQKARTEIKSVQGELNDLS
jgi:hypothetical protein